MSQALAVRMLPVAGGGKFETVGDKIRLPDDVTMGYIAEHVLGAPLTVVRQFHSHLEPQRVVGDGDGPENALHDQISFSYSKYNDEMNVVSLDLYKDGSDPTR